MHRSRFSRASMAAERFVRGYVQREAQLGAAILTHPVLARSTQALDFEFGDSVEIRTFDAAPRTAEAAALVGLVTRPRGLLLARGSLETFVIFFKPAAIHQLFGLPLVEITNRDHAARAALGVAASELQQRLGNATSFEQRVRIADRFIVSQSQRASAVDSIERAANEIVRRQGACRMDALAIYTGLSTRNFQRTFRQRIGVSPKLYARIVRFETSLKTKAALPHLSWTAIAHQFGYHDQMHLIHDFRELSGQTPTDILRDAQPVLTPQLDSVAPHETDALFL
ncbi:MAG: helix-turn-helix domain-containing protein [Gemmatimonadaceae bacterium]